MKASNIEISGGVFCRPLDYFVMNLFFYISISTFDSLSISMFAFDLIFLPS